MHYAIAHELRVFKPGYHRKYALLLAEFQVGLESDQVVHRAVPVLLAELHRRVGALPGARVGQPNGLHAAVADALKAALREYLHRHAALEHLHSRGLLRAVELL